MVPQNKTMFLLKGKSLLKPRGKTPFMKELSVFSPYYARAGIGYGRARTRIKFNCNLIAIQFNSIKAIKAISIAN